MPEILTNEWARQVMEEHEELRAKVAGLRALLEAPRPMAGGTGGHEWASRLAVRLTKLHDELSLHFSMEEESGMVEDVSTAHPRAAHEIHRIVDEHPRMLRDTRALIAMALEYSAAREPMEMPLRRRAIALLDWLDEHERQETDLIQRIEYRDTGAAD